MIRVQGWLLVCCFGWLPAGEVGSSLIGEAGLKALEAQRATVTLVAGVGTLTVQRTDPPDVPGDPLQVGFAVASHGRYDIVISDPADPDGEVTRLVSDGNVACTWERMSKGDTPKIKIRSVGTRDLLQRTLNCLHMQLADMRKEYAVELKVAAEHQRELRLVPIDKALAAEITEASVFLDNSGKPVRVVLVETGGNRQRLELRAFADNPAVDPLWFVIPKK